MIVMTSMVKLESLFGQLFDELSNGENHVVSKSSAVTTADASDKCQQQQDLTSSTSTLATTITADGNFDLTSERILFKYCIVKIGNPSWTTSNKLCGRFFLTVASSIHDESRFKTLMLNPQMNNT
ncbi:hypothetical protein Tco_0439424 [Tanacetum coccineum]